MRGARRVIAASCLVIAVATVAAVAAAAPAPRSIDAATPSQILARSMADARAQHSVHAVEVERVGTLTVIQRDFSDERSGLQELVFSTGATVDIRLFREVLYLKANGKGIQLVFSKRDNAYANRWLSVRRSNGAFPKLAEGIDFPSLLAEMPPTGPLAKSTVEVVARHRVIAISGNPNQVAQRVLGTESFDVSMRAPYLPPRISGHLRGNHRSANLVIALSSWGHNFVIEAPKRATPISSTNLL